MNPTLSPTELPSRTNFKGLAIIRSLHLTVNRGVTKNHYMKFQLSKEDLQARLQRPFFKKRAAHVLSFCDRHNLWPSNLCVHVSLSGGADSLFLTLVLKEALDLGVIKKLSVFHFNHGNRAEQKDEAEFVRDFCSKLNLPLEVIELGLTSGDNFEAKARAARQNCFSNRISKFDAIALGQHIDDSFEWSLMQQFKTSSLDSTLGIPVRNGNLIRPLMCKTSRQIRDALGTLGIPFLIDPSNTHLNYERNYVRHILIPKIKERYPSYLKNYVSRANKLALESGRHCLKQTTHQWQRFEDQFGGVGIYCANSNSKFIGGVEWLVDLIKELSLSERGTLRLQVEKMIEAQENGKKGPMKFSGGVQGYMDKGLFYFIHVDNLPKLALLDADILASLVASDIPEGDLVRPKTDYPLPGIFPFLILSTDKNAPKHFGPAMKTPHKLFPKSTELLLQRGVYFQTFTRAMSYRKGRALTDNVSFCFLQNFDSH
ncbi:MAG: tRNA lysidine(34) synthetase TilS [Deltaproteobacteria bacterium]|nr:MAG: tRNA lysidine(34) synthetase TilS [Deltaproteobacteria bacterium]